MESAFEIINKILPVFIVILLGYLYGKLKELNAESISKFVVNVTLPCLVFSLMAKTYFSFSDFATISFAALIIPLSTGFAVSIFLKITGKEDMRGFYLPTMFMNGGNMAFSIAYFAYGTEGLTKVIIYLIPSSLLCFSLSVYIASNKWTAVEMLKQPVIYALIIGAMVSFLKVPVNGAISQTADLIGQITIPMLLVILGYNLNNLQLNSVRLAVWGSVFRIGVGFLASWAIFVLILGLRDTTGKVIVLISSMPSALIVYPFAKKYDANPDVVASVIVASTLISIVTIPLVIWFLG
jgi:malate permease and related proteins